MTKIASIAQTRTRYCFVDFDAPGSAMISDAIEFFLTIGFHWFTWSGKVSRPAGKTQRRSERARGRPAPRLGAPLCPNQCKWMSAFSSSPSFLSFPSIEWWSSLVISRAWPERRFYCPLFSPGFIGFYRVYRISMSSRTLPCLIVFYAVLLDFYNSYETRRERLAMDDSYFIDRWGDEWMNQWDMDSGGWADFTLSSAIAPFFYFEREINDAYGRHWSPSTADCSTWPLHQDRWAFLILTLGRLKNHEAKKIGKKSGQLDRWGNDVPPR